MFLHEILFMCNSLLIFSGFLDFLQEEIKNKRPKKRSLKPTTRVAGRSPAMGFIFLFVACLKANRSKKRSQRAKADWLESVTIKI